MAKKGLIIGLSATSVVIIATVLIVLWFTVFNRMYYCGKLKVKNENIDMTKIKTILKDDIIHFYEGGGKQGRISKKMNVSVYGSTITVTAIDNKKDSVKFDISNKTGTYSGGTIFKYDDVYHNKSLNLIIFVIESNPAIAIDSSYFHC
tara:strand:- start:2280 stop:2723 length:444 start_codon:yes stop_codon:yes gene_type:complete